MLKHIKNFLTKREEKQKNDPKIDTSYSGIKEESKTHHMVLYSCNGCGAQISPPTDERWACNECSNFDLCKECHRKEMILIEGTQEEKDKLLLEDKYEPIQHYDPAQLPHLLTLENQTQFQLIYSLRGNSTFETMEKAFKYFTKRQCLGYREHVPITEETPLGLSSQYKWLSYGEVYKRTLSLANSMTHFIERRDFISIYMDNCIEWYISDFASLWAGLVVVPLHHSSNNLNLLEILSNSESSCIVTEKESFKNLIELYDQLTDEMKKEKPTKVKLIIHKENDYDQLLVDRLPEGIVFKTFSEMIEIGDSKPAKYEFKPIGPNDLSSVNYTSGSTGTPKGVMKIDATFNLLIINSYVQFPYSVYSYNTLSHSQRLSDWRYIFMGGKVAIYSGDKNNIFSDLALVRPHSFWAVPRFWALIYNQFKNDLKQYQNDNPGIDEKLATLHCYKGIRALLGNRVSGLVTGGAPTSPEVLQFIKHCWKDINLSNSYGLTEVSGVCTDGIISDDVEYKIEPVASLGYYPTDLPNPRGELVVKSSTMSAGYYKNDQLTAESFAGGWFRTGDIVEQIGARKVKIIDRIKHAFKLANGEFVAPEPLETHFVSLCINQIFIYGNSLKTFLVAVVKPTDQCLQQLGLFDIPRDQLIDNPILKTKLLQEINIISKEKKLANYEIPKIITIDFTEWNIDNKLITGSGKFARNELYKFYKDKINQMFDTIDRVQENLRSNNNNGENSINGNDQFESYIKSILNITDNNDGGNEDGKFNLESLSFIQIGGDSLGAIKLSSLLKEKENIDIAPSTILNQNFNLASLSKLINEKESIPKEEVLQDLNENLKIDWKSEMILDTDIEERLNLKSISISESLIKTVFITGVTGYLGTYLLLNLLESKEVEKVYCLIRNISNENQGLELIEKIFNKSRITGWSIDKLRERVVPVCGDLSKQLFGVSTDTFKMLSNSVDMVIHNGATVNMAYPYANMKAINVTSTRDILRLCVGGPFVKRLAYVSTVGVYFGNDQHVDENTTPSTLFLDYGNGYNQSKLISDILVRKAASLGLPTMIFRPGTIFSHTETGFNNQNDFVGLIIKGILGSKSYPIKSDYTGGDLNLSPVDWVSSSMISLIKHLNYWSEQKNSAQIFNMVNQNQLPIDKLCQFINKDVTLEPISYSSWKELQFNSSSNPLYSVSPSFKKSNDRFPGGHPVVCPKTQKYLESIGKSQCDSITESVVLKYVDYLISNNLIQTIKK